MKISTSKMLRTKSSDYSLLIDSNQTKQSNTVSAFLHMLHNIKSNLKQKQLTLFSNYYTGLEPRPRSRHAKTTPTSTSKTSTVSIGSVTPVLTPSWVSLYLLVLSVLGRFTMLLDARMSGLCPAIVRI